MQPGQIAHLDQNNENNDEDNLAFMCLVHHDQYDGKTSVSKGIKESEARHWRDMLHQEMADRFRTPKKMEMSLEVLGFKYCGPTTELCVVFRLKNTGEMMARHPTVSVRLPENIAGRKPPDKMSVPGGFVTLPSFDMWAAVESRQDIFETNGRVMLWELGGAHPILMPGHSLQFDALTVWGSRENAGTNVTLEYQVDAEGFPPTRGTAEARIPAAVAELLVDEADDGDEEEE